MDANAVGDFDHIIRHDIIRHDIIRHKITESSAYRSNR
jgi:hypothetical protein